MTASNVVVMVVSEDYARKSWPIHERQSAIARAINERREYILPVRFDNTMLPGLDPSLSYLPLENRPPAKLAENIMAKLVQLGGRVEPPKPAFRAKDAADVGRNVCRVIVHDENGVPVESATVLLVAQTARRTRAKQVPTALPRCPPRCAGPSAVFVAHPQHRAAFYRQHDNGTDLEVTLPARRGCSQRHLRGQYGPHPGFGPRLTPIGNNHDAEGVPPVTYMYLDNGSVDGRTQQPFHFRVGRR